MCVCNFKRQSIRTKISGQLINLSTCLLEIFTTLIQSHELKSSFECEVTSFHRRDVNKVVSMTLKHTQFKLMGFQPHVDSHVNTVCRTVPQAVVSIYQSPQQQQLNVHVNVCAAVCLPQLSFLLTVFQCDIRV